MTDADYRAALRLLDCVLQVLQRRSRVDPRRARWQLQTTAREFHLLRARLGQPVPERN